MQTTPNSFYKFLFYFLTISHISFFGPCRLSKKSLLVYIHHQLLVSLSYLTHLSFILFIISRTISFCSFFFTIRHLLMLSQYHVPFWRIIFPFPYFFIILVSSPNVCFVIFFLTDTFIFFDICIYICLHVCVSPHSLLNGKDDKFTRN